MNDFPFRSKGNCFAIYFGFALSIVFEVRLKEDFMRETRKNDKQKRSRLSICQGR